MRGTVHWMVAESKLVAIPIRLVGFTGGVGPIGRDLYDYCTGDSIFH